MLSHDKITIDSGRTFSKIGKMIASHMYLAYPHQENNASQVTQKLFPYEEDLQNYFHKIKYTL